MAKSINQLTAEMDHCQRVEADLQNKKTQIYNMANSGQLPNYVKEIRKVDAEIKKNRTKYAKLNKQYQTALRRACGGR